VIKETGKKEKRGFNPVHETLGLGQWKKYQRDGVGRPGFPLSRGMT